MIDKPRMAYGASLDAAEYADILRSMVARVEYSTPDTFVVGIIAGVVSGGLVGRDPVQQMAEIRSVLDGMAIVNNELHAAVMPR